MRKLLLGALVAFVSIGVCYAEQETVASREKPFMVTYPDGSTERYVAKYRAIAEWDKHESGGPAKPFEGKLIDDRQCHWNIETRIVRDVCLLSRTGQQFCEGTLNKVYGTSFAGKGSDFVLLKLQSENCGDADARFRSDLNDARNAVRDVLDATATKDNAVVSSDMKTQFKATSVAAQ